jgi:hypothetical protein
MKDVLIVKSKFEDKSKAIKLEELLNASGMIPDKLFLFK